MSFHKRLKHLREKQGVSPTQMAKELKVSLSTYRDWEYGRKITGEPYLKIASVLGVGLNELLGNDTKHYKDIKETLHQIKISLKKLENICESFF